MFRGRKLLIATKHKKEEAIAKHIEHALGVKCIVKEDFDTDALGTFTGEKERIHSPMDTVKLKCLQAMEKFGFDLAIANEGSFGPHPALYFIPADEEMMILIDKKLNIEITVKIVSTQTNFNGKAIKHITELEQFATAVQFPSHGIILRKGRDSNESIIKDISSWEMLSAKFNDMLASFGEVFVETDMRAMRNPSRMKVIEELTIKLIDAINSQCPSCSSPGFIPIKWIPGLACALCGRPTKSIKAAILGCKKCGFELEKEFPKNKKQEDPQFCDYCNP